MKVTVYTQEGEYVGWIHPKYTEVEIPDGRTPTIMSVEAEVDIPDRDRETFRAILESARRGCKDIGEGDPSDPQYVTPPEREAFFEPERALPRVAAMIPRELPYETELIEDGVAIGKIEKEGQWRPYEGPNGGKGWQDMTDPTDVRYQDDPPGEVAEGYEEVAQTWGDGYEDLAGDGFDIPNESQEGDGSGGEDDSDGEGEGDGSASDGESDGEDGGGRPWDIGFTVEVDLSNVIDRRNDVVEVKVPDNVLLQDAINVAKRMFGSKVASALWDQGTPGARGKEPNVERYVTSTARYAARRGKRSGLDRLNERYRSYADKKAEDDDSQEAGESDESDDSGGEGDDEGGGQGQNDESSQSGESEASGDDGGGPDVGSVIAEYDADEWTDYAEPVAEMFRADVEPAKIVESLRENAKGGVRRPDSERTVGMSDEMVRHVGHSAYREATERETIEGVDKPSLAMNADNGFPEAAREELEGVIGEESLARIEDMLSSFRDDRYGEGTAGLWQYVSERTGNDNFDGRGGDRVAEIVGSDSEIDPDVEAALDRYSEYTTETLRAEYGESIPMYMVLDGQHGAAGTVERAEQYGEKISFEHSPMERWTSDPRQLRSAMDDDDSVMIQRDVSPENVLASSQFGASDPQNNDFFVAHGPETTYPTDDITLSGDLAEPEDLFELLDGSVATVMGRDGGSAQSSTNEAQSSGDADESGDGGEGNAN